jgi:threonylcarbamoyladenosine tRNA methylthiotransferase MtaB
MPHLHLSLQSGDDMILKRMKRRHSRQDAVEICAKLRRLRSDIVFGADLIAGFPTESEAMFENSRKLIEDCGLIWLHVFPYSARTGTPAARMPQLPMALRRERAARLRAAGATARQNYLAARVGGIAEVLVERGCAARDQYYASVELDAELAPGSLAQARILAVGTGRLIGQITGQAAT